ncbi:MAG: hypothetical protein V3U54_13580 [Thermodesulfobacteriota bacterium]
MPKLDSNKIRKRFGAEQKANIAYGNQSIVDIYPRDEPDAEAWDLINLLFKQPLKVSEAIYFSTAVSQEGREVFIIPWSKKEDPFTQTDLLDSEEDQVQELIFRFRTSLSIPYRERLANRLLSLFNDAKEEDPDSLGITLGSIRDFYNFLQLHTNLKCPTISLTPDDNIYASWRDEQNRLFSVHFLPNGDVYFVVFKPNDKHPERKIKFSGTATIDTLRNTVASSGVWDWISNER